MKPLCEHQWTAADYEELGRILVEIPDEADKTAAIHQYAKARNLPLSKHPRIKATPPPTIISGS